MGKVPLWLAARVQREWDLGPLCGYIEGVWGEAQRSQPASKVISENRGPVVRWSGFSSALLFSFLCRVRNHIMGSWQFTKLVGKCYSDVLFENCMWHFNNPDGKNCGSLSVLETEKELWFRQIYFWAVGNLSNVKFLLLWAQKVFRTGSSRHTYKTLVVLQQVQAKGL